jgi:Zn-dependent protease with chaperone function
MTRIEISGDYADGKTSRLEPATLALYEDGSVEVSLITTGERLFVASNDTVVVNSRLGNTPRVVQLQGDIRFITPDNEGVDQYLAAIGKSHALIHRLESSMGMVVFSVILTVVLVSGYLASGLPYTARVVADSLPDSVLQSLGAGSLEVFDKLWVDPSKLRRSDKDALLSTFESYLRMSSVRNARIEFRSGIGPNAFALPDGTIVFTDELVTLADNNEELIAILLHEIGHLEHKHLLRRTIQSSMLTVMVVLVVGDLESADLMLGLPTVLLDLDYSRDFELEADRYALTQLKAHGISVDHFAGIMTKLQDFYSNADVRVARANANDVDVENDAPTQAADEDQSELASKSASKSESKSVLNYFSTHPATHERIQLIKEYR